MRGAISHSRAATGALARLALILASSLAVLTATEDPGALARPGGGNTYRSSGGSRSTGGGSTRSYSTPSRSDSTPSRSGSSRSSSSSSDRDDDDDRGRSRSGGGGGELFGLIAWLAVAMVRHPVLSLSIFGALGVAWVLLKRKDGWGGTSWATSRGTEPVPRMEPARVMARSTVEPSGPLFGNLPPLGAVETVTKPSKRAELLAASRHDPDFSLVLFEDFLYSLYAEAHRARGGGGLDLLAPYLSSPARASLSRYRAASVETIVVGGMRVEQVWKPPALPDAIQVVVAFDANYTEVDEAKHARSWMTREVWTLERKLTARSRPADKTRVFGCPNCGAPLTSIRSRTCLHCKQIVDTGAYDWVAVRIAVPEREQRGSMLGGETIEVGTHDPTVVDPNAASAWDALVARDPSLTWEGIVERVKHIFTTFHAAWNAQEMMLARAVLSDHLFQAQTFWIDAYRAAGLKNLTGRPSVATVHPAQVLSDAHFDSVTVRVFATGLDYTIDAQGKVVAGSTTANRDYSEYWTLIRSVKRTGASGDDASCPSCGGPLELNMAGHCGHCNARVSSGEFDWVLSRIEQDESYEG